MNEEEIIKIFLEERKTCKKLKNPKAIVIKQLFEEDEFGRWHLSIGEYKLINKKDKNEIIKTSNFKK